MIEDGGNERGRKSSEDGLETSSSSRIDGLRIHERLGRSVVGLEGGLCRLDDHRGRLRLVRRGRGGRSGNARTKNVDQESGRVTSSLSR